MKKVKFLTVFIMAFVLIAGSFAYAYPNRFTWFQSETDYYVYAHIGGLIGDPHINNSVKFSANVYSPVDGTFKMTLQKKTFWWWSDIDYTYTKVQNRHGWQAVGYWWSPEAGEYRVRLHSPSSPQVTVFTNVRFYRHY
jgi:hypothetical protein